MTKKLRTIQSDIPNGNTNDKPNSAKMTTYSRCDNIPEEKQSDNSDNNQIQSTVDDDDELKIIP
jgi:hypothetical protein